LISSLSIGSNGSYRDGDLFSMVSSQNKEIELNQRNNDENDEKIFWVFNK